MFRGNGAPIVDLSVFYHRGKRNEVIPSGFYALRKNLNAGQKRKENPMLCVKRAPSSWKADVEPKTVTGEKPITNLYVAIVKRGAHIAPQGPPDDDKRRPVFWDGAYDGKALNINERPGGDGVFLMRTTDTRFDPITAMKIGSHRKKKKKGGE